MGGFNIGVGVGLKYPTPILKQKGTTPEPDITDALLLEDGNAMLLENGNYVMLETSAAVNEKANFNYKKYWKF